MSDDALRALVEDVTSRTGYAKAIGVQVTAVEAGRVAMMLERRPDLLQANGFFHGGVIAGLADHAAGAAVTTALPEGRFAVTIDLQVNFLAPADGERLIACAETLRVGAMIGVARVEVYSTNDGAQTHCAAATVTLRATPLAPSPA